MEEQVIVCAFNKGTNFNLGYPSTVCDRKDAQKEAKYYRSIGYNAKVLTFDEYDELIEREKYEWKIGHFN